MDKNHTQKKPTQGASLEWAKGCSGKNQSCTTIGFSSGHGSGSRYSFDSYLLNTGAALGQFGHEDSGVFDLDRSRNAARHPVLDALLPTFFLDLDEFGHLGRAAELADQVRVEFDLCLHPRITHHV